MERKKSACLKLSTAVLCVWKRKDNSTIQDYVYTVQVKLLSPVSNKRNEKNIGRKGNGENGLNLVTQCQYPASLQVFHNRSLYSGNLECMSLQRRDQIPDIYSCSFPFPHESFFSKTRSGCE